MMPRPARFSDIPSLMVLMQQAFANSAVADEAEIDEETAENMMVQVIGGQKDTAKLGSMAMFVTGEVGDVTGMIAGSVMPMYMALTLPMVTDFIWYVDPDRAAPRDGAALLSALHEWADTLGIPVRRQHSVTSMVMNPNVTGRMMRRAGYRMTGLIFEKEK